MLDGITDEQLEIRLHDLVEAERAGLAEFLDALIEFERRELPLKRAYGSTFDYCRRKLRLSEDEAYKRIQAARAARDHRLILEFVRRGDLSLTAVTRLAPHLNSNNAGDLIGRCVGKTIREVEEVVAALSIASAHPADDIIRVVPIAARPAAPRQPMIPEAPAQDDAKIEPSGAPPARAAVEAGYRFHFTAAKPFYEKLRRAIDLSRHRRPRARLEEILEDALDALLDAVDRGRKKEPARPREDLPGRRRIPEWVKDAVWRRDDGRCAFLEQEGRRCGSTGWLEFDHVKPFALGGSSDDPGNVRLLCRAHNQREAREAGLTGPEARGPV